MEEHAKFTNGMVQLADKSYIFHMIHSRPLAVILGISGNDVPSSVLFSTFSDTASNCLSLYSQSKPMLSMVRLILSVHPYALNSQLMVGFKQSNGVMVIHRDPVITSSDHKDTIIKVPTTVMSCSNRDMSDAKPLSVSMCGKLMFSASNKQVIIDESLNECFTFSSHKPVSKHKIKHKSTALLKPILKKPLVHDSSHVTSFKNAQIFFSLQDFSNLQIGTCPVVSFNTILVMARSQNSLVICTDDSINRYQMLFLKHVVLDSMCLESCMQHFMDIYENRVIPITAEQHLSFNNMVKSLKDKLEDATFALNSIEDAQFHQRVVANKCHPSNILLMEKYFLMFPPKDKKNSINFAAGILEIIFRGTSFNKVVTFLKNYMEIKDTTPENNMFKIYALLTS
ncbi:tegument protein UL88 [Vespertilionid gammaherpesvirus 1]|uniref:Tegument protein UL88 n=1 Tax=Vespertilionid gammaherpesvirus 1 TaxID=2560830 RepID=A0A0X9X642_9GAMA|nr:tegument protein UL88 [Myotis gammaherpesvirus 8]AMA67380.1 tegument protein UL88 [Vespertilionid gammaherpesvirus 1]